MKEPVHGFCSDRDSIFCQRLPRWATGLRLRKEFTELPTVENLYNLFSRATFWWSRLSGNRGKWLSRHARLLLYAATGKDYKSMGRLPTEDLLKMKCTPAGLGRIKQWLLTLSGLCMSLFLGSYGIDEVNNWYYFDKVFQFYLTTAVMDLYKKEGETYYSRLKSFRGLLKNKILKERSSLEEFDVPDDFWYYRPILKGFFGVTRLSDVDQVIRLSMLTQTRGCGLANGAVRATAMDKFYSTIQDKPRVLTAREQVDVSKAVHSLFVQLVNTHDFHGAFNRSLMESKISVSNSACLEMTRERGGKSEAARLYLRSLMGKRIPIFNLDTGRVSQHIVVTKNSAPGEVLFHYGIYESMRFFKTKGKARLDPNCWMSGNAAANHPALTGCWVSTVVENGKARVITVSSLLHSIVLHPLSHIFAVLIARLASSATGMKASNHMWDFYKRMRDLIPEDSIYGTQQEPGKNMFLASEDWSEATDRLNPNFAHQVVIEFGLRMNLPKFYVTLCAKLLTVERELHGPDGAAAARERYPIVGIKRRGVLQGDPLTKQVLHLSHLVSREISSYKVKKVCSKISFGFPVYESGGLEYRPFPIIPENILDKGTGAAWAKGYIIQPDARQNPSLGVRGHLLREMGRYFPNNNLPPT